ncbi:hypothetical protein MK079_02425 [Candidatus Gracilibacteria bacterium]|nr:hypothetical protein [Candidatus Gracilibacteria bacterium]
MSEPLIHTLKHQLSTLDHEILDLLRRREQIQSELHNYEASVSLEETLDDLQPEIEHQCLDAEKMKSIWTQIYK